MEISGVVSGNVLMRQSPERIRSLVNTRHAHVVVSFAAIATAKARWHASMCGLVL